MGSKPCGFRIPDSGALIPERVATAADQPLDPPRTVPAAAASAKRGIRLALEWVLPPDWGDWAMAEFPHWGPDIVRQLADGFRDHWVAKPGADATKLDWLATWRNWCRSDIAQRQHPKPKGEVLRPDFLRELR